VHLRCVRDDALYKFTLIDVRSRSQHDRTNVLQTRRALGGAHLPPTKVFRRLTASVNETYVGYVGFSRRKMPRSMACTIAEKAIRFRHQDYNPDRAQKLISSSTSRHLSTCNISSKSMHGFLSNLANRQTNKRRQMHLPPLSEINKSQRSHNCAWFQSQIQQRRQ